ncbi:hypothetical protein NS220_08400 [Microbacterium testaceum]|uniref:Polysaccharide biosynthesis protein C-terminal domain-containing protein n=1 Tax=Microbacterium testaceum TaxID=2033 RepID=A0A147EXH7_MICTE|nr:hypothetical protein NS220_08400 [Microbacterium testaceum]
MLGADTIGQWNRADVLSAVPFQQVQSALIPVVYPEFRHDLAGSDRTKAVWTDMLSLTAWLILPAAGVAAVLVPLVLPMLFGGGWDLAILLSPFICVAAAIQVVSTLLASAVEALGKFKWIWWTQGALLVVQIAVVGAIWATGSVLPAMAGLIASLVMQHAIYVALCAKHGYLDARRLLKRYTVIILASALIFVTTHLFVSLGKWLFEVNIFATSLTAVPLLSLLWTLWLIRGKLPPVRLARKYKLIE